MSTPPPSEDSLHWKRDESIDLPKPESEGRLAIRRQDWKRLKTRIQQTDDSWSLSVVYSMLFGFAGSVGPSIIPIAATQDLPSWVAPLYVCLFLFSLLCAFVFLAVDKKLKTRRRSERQDVIEEMIEIEGMFIRRKGLQNPVNVSTTEPIKNPVGLYESGQREPPLPVLLRYARIAGVYVDVLIDDELDLPDYLPAVAEVDGVMPKPKRVSKR